MKAAWTLLVVLIVGCFSLPGKGKAADTDDASAVLDSIEVKLGWIDYRLGLEKWQQFETGDADSLAFYRELRRLVVCNGANYERLRNRRSRLQSEVERRRYDLIFPVLVRAQIDNGNTIRGLYDSLAAFYSGPWCELNGQPISVEAAHRVVASSRRGTQRKLAFRTTADPGENIEQQLARLFRLRNQTARRMGYNDYFSLSADLGRFEVAEYRRQIDRIDSATRSAYDRIAKELSPSVEPEALELWDWEQRFSNTLTDADRYFPADSQMVFLRRLMAGVGFNLDRLPIYWLVESDSTAEGRVETIAVKPPHDIRIVVNLADGLEAYRRLLGAVGLGVQAALSAQESDLLSQAVDPVWSQAVSILFGKLGLLPSGLQSHTGMPAGLVARVALAGRAIDLLRLRLLLLDARFEYEAYRNPSQNLNRLYWDLSDEYTGLPRHDDLSPWAGKQEYVVQPLAFYHRLLGACAAAQNLNYIEKHYYRIGSNPELGSFLTHNYFRFGARYDWHDLVERATGEPLSPACLTTP